MGNDNNEMNFEDTRLVAISLYQAIIVERELKKQSDIQKVKFFNQ